MALLQRVFLGCLALCGAACAAAPAASVQGVVSKVVDGHTLWLTPPGQPALLLRLRDTEAPSLCQPWGTQAQAALSTLALNKLASARTAGRDGQGRTLAAVSVDGIDLGPRMVADGQAWSLRVRYDQGPLVKEERMARALGRGLHAAGGAVPPHEYRRIHGPCAAAAAANEPASAARPRTPSRAAAR